MFVRESFQHTEAVVPSLFGLPLGGTLEGAGNTNAGNQGGGIGETFQLSPQSINEVRLGFKPPENRSLRSRTSDRTWRNSSEIPGVNQSAATSGLSNLVVAGLFRCRR